MNTATTRTCENEVTILVRILGNGNGKLPEEFARYVLSLQISAGQGADA